MAGRAPGFRHNEDTRKKIKAQMIINRLMDNLMADESFLDAGQVNSAKTLLSKCLPDLQSVDLTGDIGLSVTIPEKTRDL